MGQLCSKGLDDSGPKYAAGEASPQYGGKGVVSHGDGRDGGAGAGSRTAHKASSGSGAGDSSKSATLQQLRRENQELREALAEAQRVISSTEKTQLQLDNKHQELQRSYENLASANHQLRRRFSNLTTGHLDESSGEFAGGAAPVASDANMQALMKLREANTASALPVMWRDVDYRRWSGVRVEAAAVTGLALKSIGLSALPAAIIELPKLTALILSHNRLAELPSELCGLTALRTLLLNDNELAELPPGLGQLSGLTTLWLHNNRLASLPASVGRLASLRQLLLSGNRLEVLPDTLSGLTSLHSLWLQDNQIRSLPTSLMALAAAAPAAGPQPHGSENGCGGLQRLRLGGNRLPGIPHELRHLLPDFEAEQQQQQ